MVHVLAGMADVVGEVLTPEVVAGYLRVFGYRSTNGY
jgi:hypothetical protein